MNGSDIGMNSIATDATNATRATLPKWEGRAMTHRLLSLRVMLAVSGLAGTAAAQPCAPQWDATIGQPGMGTFGTVWVVFDDGLGSLHAGGNFTGAGGQSVSNAARWDGSLWSPLGSGVTGSSGVLALVMFDDGSNLYAGGGFTTAGGQPASRVAKWDGSQWSPLGWGVNSAVHALVVFDDGSGGGPALYAGGAFTEAEGQPASRVAKWNGSQWSPLGWGMNNAVDTLIVFDDGSGSGPGLYAGGSFTDAGVSANRVAKWNGLEWSPVGSGMNNTVLAFAVFDDGSGGGPALYAGGQFTMAGGQAADRVARWNGLQWSPLGAGIASTVRTLVVFNDGTGGGPALYAGGQFTSAGGQPASRVAKWNGSQWSPLGSGVNGVVNSLAVFDDGSGGGPALYAGGQFTSAGGQPANRVAKWVGCPSTSPCYANCDESTTEPILNIADFTCFLQRFAASEVYANCDESTIAPVLNVADFTCFLQKFAFGCP